MKILGLVCMLGLAACGAEEDEVVAFVGTWQPTSGTVTTTCPGYAAETTPITTSWVWSRGVSSDIVGTDAATACALMADVANVTASAVPGQTCTVPATDGSYAVGYTGYTFVLGPDGTTAAENGSGTVTYVGGGLSLSCAFSQTASYRKIGQ
jgi:hypothetical protein